MKRYLLLGLICVSMPVLALVSASVSHIANAQSGNFSAQANVANQVWSRHYVKIINDSDIEQDYSYQFMTCVQYDGCKSESGNVRLAAHQEFEKNGTTVARVIKQAGTYVINAKTQIYGTQTVEFNAYGSLVVR